MAERLRQRTLNSLSLVQLQVRLPGIGSRSVRCTNGLINHVAPIQFRSLPPEEVDSPFKRNAVSSNLTRPTGYSVEHEWSSACLSSSDSGIVTRQIHFAVDEDRAGSTPVHFARVCRCLLIR